MSGWERHRPRDRPEHAPEGERRLRPSPIRVGADEPDCPPASRAQGLGRDSFRLSRMLSRLSRLSRAVPGCPACGPVASPAPDPGPRRARAAARAGIRPRDHCYASQRVSKLATRSHPLATCASERVRSIGRPPTAVAERGCHARSGSALLMVQRSSSGFVYEEETYRTARQPRVRCCL